MPERTVEYTVTVQRLAFNPDKLTIRYKFLDDKEFAKALEIIEADNEQLERVAEAQRKRAYLIMGVEQHDKKLIQNQLSAITHKDDGRWHATNYLTGEVEIFETPQEYSLRLKEIRDGTNKDSQEPNLDKSTGQPISDNLG